MVTGCIVGLVFGIVDRLVVDRVVGASVGLGDVPQPSLAMLSP